LTIRARGRGDDDSSPQQAAVGTTIPLLENPVDARLLMAVVTRPADEFGNPDTNTFRFRSGHRKRLPSGGLQKGAFRTCQEFAGGIRQLRYAPRAVELIDNAQQVGLLQGHRDPSGTAHLQETLLDLVETGGHSLKHLSASVGGQAQASHATVELLKLLADIKLRFR
jgi:hypothetical protein